MRFLMLLFLWLGFSSCDESVVYKEYLDLSDNLEWRRSDKREFSFEITENLSTYEHILTFRHATGYPYRDISVRITETLPNGDLIIRDELIAVRNEQGEFIGKADGDIVDISYTLDAKRTFETWGKYQYSVEHTMPRDTVHLAMELGMILKKNNK
jgi:gliding motility-associated lipoprotein GldH